ncbi:fungal-specific transcription factor domain-containing protein [Staphylotrichum tortipilum]|uniref:Fungal-specific transcription factor domain-containing protein n=1 Tax=Staphylotrichum tortipilum TaxID=2831512 RepID=A0AAN6MEW9_9PEZI|nr:fungal-specific transcription factor domain-containing protein [Staphylotrichum longicolle]
MAVSRRTGSNHGVASSSSGHSRQLPGSACEECRKRKLRCDRQRPQCGTCVDAGIACEVNNNRLARGPKKGDLKALRSRIGEYNWPQVWRILHITTASHIILTRQKVALERRLSIDLIQDPLDILTGDSVAVATCTLPLPTEALAAAVSVSDARSPTHLSPCHDQTVWDEIHVQVPPMTPTSAPLSFSTFQFPPTPPSPQRNTFVDDLTRADLDQLYFERVHPSLPIFNHTRYFAKARQTLSLDGPSPMLCLQHAMWTLAMALSSQFESSRELLYSETRHMLEVLDLADDDLQPVRIEHVQAWLLLAFYELTRASYRRASVSAGRAFRLVQLAQLNEVDRPGSQIEGEDAVATEERRRTFWVAYCLDRLICMRSRGPLTLTEELLCTRLPSPELAFQSGHPIPGCFLPEALAAGDHNFLAPLTESVLVVTICGRALTHGQVASTERAFHGTPLDFWLRHEWLDSMLTRALDSLAVHAPMVSAMADPLVYFTFMLAHATTIFLCQIAEAASGLDSNTITPNTTHGCHPAAPVPMIHEYQQRATRAAREIAALAKAHEHIGFFKAHIFLPLTVALGAARLMGDRKRQQQQKLEGAPQGGGYYNSPPDHQHQHQHHHHHHHHQGGLDGNDQTGGAVPLVVDLEVQCCVDALRKSQCFNQLARDHLVVIESREYVFGSGVGV